MRYTNFAAYGVGALLLAILCANSLHSQIVYPFQTYGGSGTNFPFNLPDQNHGIRYQVVYGSQEAAMQQGIGSGGIITAIEFSCHVNFWSAGTLGLLNCVVRIGHTDRDYQPGPNQLIQSNMNGNFKPNTFVATCISGSFSANKISFPGSPYGAPGHVLRFNLQRAYAWNGGGGADNLLVDIAYSGRTTSGGGVQILSNAGRRVIWATGAGVNASTNQAGTGSDFGNCYTGLVVSIGQYLDVEPMIKIFSTQDWPAGTATVTTPANATGPASTNWIGDGLLVGQFDIVNPFAGNACRITSITLEDRSIPGDSRTAFTDPASPPATPGLEYGVRLWRDSSAGGTADGVFDPNFDIPMYDPLNFPGELPGKKFTTDDGTITFNLPATDEDYPGGTVRTYFIVVKLQGAEQGSTTPAPADKYQFRVKAISADPTNVILGLPGAPEPCFPYFPGISIEIPTFTYTDLPLGQRVAYLNSQNNVLQAFTVNYDRGPLNYQNTMTLTAPVDLSPTDGDDSVDYAGIRLVLDNDANNQWTQGVDQVVASIPANHFPMDDSSVTFIIATGIGEPGEFIAPVTKQFLVLVDFNTIGARGSTYQAQITAAGGHQFGAQVVGIPCPGTPVPGLILEGNDLLCTRVGPPPPDITVSNISQGPNGWGELLLIVEIVSLNRDWSVTDIIFTCTGVGTGANPAVAFSEVALYEDLNSNAPNFDGPAIDAISTALPGTFTPQTPSTATYSATIINQTFASTALRTFYLRVKLGGTALFGQRYYCNVTSITWNMAPTGGLVSIQPTVPLTNGIVIDAPTLTVTAAPTSPISQIVEAGETFGHTIAVFRFQAENEDINIAGITLTTGGTGDFYTDLASTNGIEIYLDSELPPFAPKDGLYTEGVDVLLAQSGGNFPKASVPFNISGAIVVPNGQFVDLIIRYNILATAGASLPETFRCSISDPADILTAGSNAVILGIPVPNSNTVGVIVYFVSSFIPTVSLRGGGAPITVIGAGFTPPVSLTIGGIPCPGNPVINSDGTAITGFLTPAGDGLDLPIVLTTGALGSRALPMKFNYATASTVQEHQARLSNNACAAKEASTSSVMAALLAVVASLGVASWIKRARRNDA